MENVYTLLKGRIIILCLLRYIQIKSLIIIINKQFSLMKIHLWIKSRDVISQVFFKGRGAPLTVSLKLVGRPGTLEDLPVINHRSWIHSLFPIRSLRVSF